MSDRNYRNLPGPAGILEAALTQPEATPVACAVLCHPHPQYGGSMHDGVLAIAESQLTKHKVCTLSFNFRGVGASDGSFDQGRGEAQDALAAVDWMRQQYPDLPCLLLGYSFGAAAAWRAAGVSAHGLMGLWLIAPPVQMFDMTVSPTGVPICLFHPDADDFTSVDRLHQWATGLTDNPPTEILIPGANHFFGNTQDGLADAIAGQAERLLPNR